MRNFYLLFLAFWIFPSCQNQKGTKQKGICNETSEWRDHNGADSCSYYSPKETCPNIIGKLNIITRLHKNILEEGVFEGGMSSRWLEIEKNSITYYTPSGKMADRGTCQCKNGQMKIKWEIGDNLPKEATVYFSSPDTVELRYYDFPFDFNNFSYDKSEKPTNPTKILGTIEKN